VQPLPSSATSHRKIVSRPKWVGCKPTADQSEHNQQQAGEHKAPINSRRENTKHNKLDSNGTNQQQTREDMSTQ